MRSWELHKLCFRLALRQFRGEDWRRIKWWAYRAGMEERRLWYTMWVWKHRGNGL